MSGFSEDTEVHLSGTQPSITVTDSACQISRIDPMLDTRTKLGDHFGWVEIDAENGLAQNVSLDGDT